MVDSGCKPRPNECPNGNSMSSQNVKPKEPISDYSDDSSDSSDQSAGVASFPQENRHK